MKAEDTPWCYGIIEDGTADVIVDTLSYITPGC